MASLHLAGFDGLTRFPFLLLLTVSVVRGDRVATTWHSPSPPCNAAVSSYKRDTSTRALHHHPPIQGGMASWSRVDRGNGARSCRTWL